MNSPWLAIFEHRFIDGNLSNCRHVDGSLEVSPAPPQVLSETLPDGVLSYFGRFDGKANWLRFDLDVPIDGVIGTEVGVRARTHWSPSHSGWHHLATGGDWSLGVRGRQLVAVSGGAETIWPAFPYTRDRWIDVRWSWRSNGQSMLYFDGALVAVRPDVAAGRGYRLASLFVGCGTRIIQAIPPALPVRVPFLLFPGDIKYARVSVLTLERAQRALDGTVSWSANERGRLDPCLEELSAAVQALMRLFQDLMSSIAREQTSTWVREDGGRPVTPEGARLHDHAQQAAAAIVRYLAGDGAALEEFRSYFDTFLSLLGELAGERIEDLARRVEGVLREIRVSEECVEAAKDERVKDLSGFSRLDALLEAVLSAIRAAFGVNW